MTNEQLELISRNVRKHILTMSKSGGCFLGAAMSCVETMVYLYGKQANISPETTQDPNRDYVFLSNGHDVPSLYGTLAEFGFLEASRLEKHLDISDVIFWHPHTDIPGVEFRAGSLGHLLSVATGVALDIKMRGEDNQVYVMLGDGELNEGSNWEAILVAQAHNCDNLTIVIDRNNIQANMRTEDLIPLEPLADKFRVFGCQVEECDGHNFDSLATAFEAERESGKPKVVIAHTARGKGLQDHTDRVDRWFYTLNESEYTSFMQEVEA